MQCGIVAVLIVLLITATGADARRQRAAGEDLMQVITPTSRAVANAHPHVNVMVGFGSAKDGTPADPSTFRAKFNGRDVTGDFLPILAGDVQTGVRATIPARMLKLSNAPRNRLRLSIQGVRSSGGKGPRVRDVDRLRFGAADGPNQPPIVALTAGSQFATLGEPVDFDASASHDPDQDELTFEWTFSDGATASGPTVSHTFATAGGATVSATVTVSDGVTPAADTKTLPIAIEPDVDRTKGVLRIEANTALEFSAVAAGAAATRSLTIRNVDTNPLSQLKVQAFTDDPAFTVAPATLDLGPDASAQLDVTFTPAAAGHADAQLMLLASASNRAAVTLLAHGFGGTAPGDGPTLLGVPVFGIGIGVTLLAPDGTSVAVDESTGTCAPPTGFASGDACVVDGDCSAAGETCSGAATPLDVSELCSDGQSLFVLAEDTYTDPNPDADPGLSGSVVRFDLDAGGAVTNRRMLYRTTDGTTQIACDQIPAAAGGLAYLAEFHSVDSSASCDRDERDALVTLNKTTGNARSVMSRIDQAAGVGDCAFRDAVSELRVSDDGVKKYAAFDSAGLWRILPTPVAFTPDVHDGFRIAPDGSVVFAIAHDRGATATIDLYRMSEAQVEHGSLPVAVLAPCASFAVPNDTSAAAPASTGVISLVLGPSALAPSDSVALVTFRARTDPPSIDVLPPFGDVRGTVAFSLAGASTACSAQGLVTLSGVELQR
jgi:PKD repeat protein